MPWRVVFCEKMKNQVRNGGGGRFRQALCDGKDGARYIATLKGRGYSFVAPISQSSGRGEDIAAAARLPHPHPPGPPDRTVWARARTTLMSDRRNSESKDVLSFGPFSLFAAERLLKKGDDPIPLGGRALDILIALVERAG